MSAEFTPMNRRKMLKTMALGAAGTMAYSTLSHATEAVTTPNFPLNLQNLSPQELAQDESFWAQIALFYDKAPNIINLEHGYWGKMSTPVQSNFIENTQMVNKHLSVYARKHYRNDMQLSSNEVAKALGAKNEEIALTRNASESIHNLIRQYKGLTSRDTVLYTDIDYPSFKDTMRWLGDTNNLKAVELTLPAQATQQQILDIYIKAFEQYPSTKLMLLTHVSNQHGLVLPVAEIAKVAKQKGIDIICDCAQSWGLLDFKITDLNVDWAGFNLHKWIGSPVGVGALYMKERSLEKVHPYPGEHDASNTNVNARVHMATSNFASILSIPAALDFHHKIGGANKEARLLYLQNLWTSKARKMQHIEVLGGLDKASSTGMASFRLVGQSSKEEVSALQKRLELEFGIFTVIRVGLASGCCIRITPQVFTTAHNMHQFVLALEEIADSA
ncbi:aminotransferase class V-fold PLP-dependent enzyme [Glaciecola sp. 2405UD65-10]|uniref:aminotransferase class V-fold PLP-dependent enzyme n=1 Tax=Glaciecola sp. 2405UD65-10 TaxID=3397244 RepID=UPI003B5964A9